MNLMVFSLGMVITSGLLSTFVMRFSVDFVHKCLVSIVVGQSGTVCDGHRVECIMTNERERSSDHIWRDLASG